MTNRPLISVCIPSYNRKDKLPELLDSIFNENFKDFNIVICEDNSPQRPEIRSIVAQYKEKHPDFIQYHENSNNLGYDGNIRALIGQASGEYCFFMGNDDLVYPGALGEVANAIDKYDNVGAILRSYKMFENAPDNVVQTFQYFQEDRFFEAGVHAISTFFRRFVVISGDVLHRDTAYTYATDKFDGTLLYQLYVVSKVLKEKNGVYLRYPMSLYRNNGTPDFGNSDAEKGKFTPTEQTPESSIHFVAGMLKIAKAIDYTSDHVIYKAIARDLGNYAYPIIAIQSKQNKLVFLKYCFEIAKLGFWKYAMFYVYAIALFIFGESILNRLIINIKKYLRYTPVMGSVYRGKAK